MTKFLVGQSEEFDSLLIIEANDENSAIDKYIENIKPDESFLEDLHGWSCNLSFSEKFHYDEKSEGQKNLPKKEIQRRVSEYFKEKPEYEEIYWKHWNAKRSKNAKKSWSNYLMADFPENMAKWIFKIELRSGCWTTLRAINLDEINTYV